METSNICIRKAQFPEMEDIFWLLHSESFAWNTEQIEAELNNLYVMTCKDKLIGVAYCKSSGGGMKFCWAAIHPMYPKEAMSGILYHSLVNLGSNISRLANSCYNTHYKEHKIIGET